MELNYLDYAYELNQLEKFVDNKVVYSVRDIFNNDSISSDVVISRLIEMIEIAYSKGYERGLEDAEFE